MEESDLLNMTTPSSTPLRKGRLLIVDDELSVLRAVSKVLQKQGYETQECISGTKALAVLQQAEFDVLLCDIMMAGMDGITLLRSAHEIAPELVGILMTGKSSVESAVEAMRAGAFDYILKPLSLSVVLPVLERAMEFRRLRTENVQLHEMIAVYGLSSAIAFSLESETILRKTAEAVVQACHADEVTIVLPKADEKEWYIAMAVGEHREHLRGQIIKLEQTIEGWMIRHREPLLLQGGVQDPRFTPVVPRTDIHSSLALPLMTGGRLVGVLNINATKRQRAFTPADQKAASIVASMAAPALINTRLYQELELRVQERTAELRNANEVLQREVVERQRAEAAVRREEEYFRSLTENALDLVSLVNAEGKIRYMSPSISPLLGYQAEELVGQLSIHLLHPDDQVRVQEEFARLLTTPGSMTNVEYRIRRKDGSYRVLESVIHNLLANPAVAGMVINARDITERKEAVRVKEEMVAVVSHELRTPITSLRGFAELLLKRSYPVEKQQEFLTIIHNEAVRLNNLTNDFLDMQHLQSGRMVYHFASVELMVFLSEAIAPFIQEEGKHAIRLEIANGLPSVQADADRLRQVLVNLLSNAIKFSPQGGEITVSAQTEGARVTVWVADQGLGIPREEIPKLFDKFQRAERHETRGIGGTGLGLALAKQIITAHHGTIWVESEVGKGSTFFFTLPCTSGMSNLQIDDDRSSSDGQGS
jgi:PAS domain S-box-containing protein